MSVISSAAIGRIGLVCTKVNGGGVSGMYPEVLVANVALLPRYREKVARFDKSLVDKRYVRYRFEGTGYLLRAVYCSSFL